MQGIEPLRTLIQYADQVFCRVDGSCADWSWSW